MTIIKRGGSTSDSTIGLHGVPAFLSGQTEHRLGRLLFNFNNCSVHGVALPGLYLVVGIQPAVETAGYKPFAAPRLHHQTRT